MRKLLCIIGCVMIGMISCETNVSKDMVSPASEAVIFRYDKLLNDYVSYNSFSALQKLSGEYRAQTRILVENVLRLGAFEDDDYNLKLQAVYSDSLLQSLSSDVLDKYDKLQTQEAAFNKAFTRMGKLLPGVQVPTLYAQISALNQSVVVQDSLVGISLDKYMGSDYPLYVQYFDDYERAMMKPERILPDVMRFYLMALYPFPEEKPQKLIHKMLYLGKINYISSKLLDYSSPDEFLDYSQEKRKWCKDSSAVVWNYMNDQEHLLSEEAVLLDKYLEHAPYTDFFGEQSPSRLGVWMGMLIVDSYMTKHRDVEYEAILTDHDYEKFLSEAQFNL